MSEEYQESEVVFQESVVGFEEVEDEDDAAAGRRGSRNKKKQRRRDQSISLPVNIPDMNLSRSWLRGCLDNKEGESVDDGEMVPPHVITGRRIAGKMMQFSVCTGNGRTLKGRDLSQVRNSILRMTGFLET